MIIFIILASLLSLATAAALAAPLLRTNNAEAASRTGRLSALAACGLMPLLAGLIYMAIGMPAALDPAVRNAPPPSDDPTAALAAMSPEERQAAIDTMVSGLTDRLQEQPNDLLGWRMLARSFNALGRHDEASAAWREAVALSEGSADDWRGLGMSLVEEGRTGNTSVGPDIRAAFQEVIAREPDDVLALYFLGYAAKADDNPAEAISYFIRLRSLAEDGSNIALEMDMQLEALSDPQQANSKDETTPGTED